MIMDGSMMKQPLVYLVEDGPEVASALSDILRRSGCQVQTFAGGRELIAYPTDTSPDVVVTDYVMQPIDGIAVAVWVKNTYPRARIVMITADEHLARRAAGYPLPFQVLEKPFSSVALIAAVHDGA